MSTRHKHLEQLMQCMMIDTMALRVPDVPRLKLTKEFARVSEDPALAHSSGWGTSRLKSKHDGLPSLKVGTIKSKRQLTVEGSNAMHQQGHNIVSSGDAVMTAYSMLAEVASQHKLNLDAVERPLAFMRGEGIEVGRVDTPCLLRVPQGLNKGAIINALALAGLSTDGVITLFPRETVYFDQHSQLESLKAYDKSAEIAQAKRKFEFPETNNGAALRMLSRETVRLEAVYRLKALTRRFGRGKATPAMLSPKVLAEMLIELLQKYNLHGSLRRRLSLEELWKIRSPYRTTVALWQRGENMISIFNHDEGLLKSHRRVIKYEHGIDILNPPPGAIDMPIELGEILCAENFVPIPPQIRADRAMFYQLDMPEVVRDYCSQHGLRNRHTF